MRGLVLADRAPRTIVLENVYGCLTSHGGKDFAAISSALADLGYKFGAAVINASHFVPQSRPRVFFIAVRKGEPIPTSLVAPGPQPGWHPASLTDAYGGMTPKARRNWVWWDVGMPATRKLTFSDLVEDIPTGVKWHAAAHTQYLLELMTPLHRQKVARAMNSGRRTVGTIYRRTRPDENGTKRQRVEVRFDEIAGCLRTPAGGSQMRNLALLAAPDQPQAPTPSRCPTGCGRPRSWRTTVTVRSTQPWGRERCRQCRHTYRPTPRTRAATTSASKRCRTSRSRGSLFQRSPSLKPMYARA